MKTQRVKAIKRHIYDNKIREVGQIYTAPALHAEILRTGHHVVPVTAEETSNPVEKPEVYPEFPVKKRRGRRPAKEQTYSRRDMRAEP